MKKILIFLIPFLLFSCATTKLNENIIPEKDLSLENDFAYSVFYKKTGEDLIMIVDSGFFFYGTTDFVYEGFDCSLPKVFGDKTLVTTLPYTFYFDGKKHEVMYELIIQGVELNEEILNLPLFAEIKAGTVIGKATIDEPKIMIRTVTGYEPNLVLNSSGIPTEVGDYVYFDASTLMRTTPKFLTYQPISTTDDFIEFGDYPDTIKNLANASVYNDENEHIGRFPSFNVLVKTQLENYPEKIVSETMNDIVLRNQFYSECETELTTIFDEIPFHLVFQPGFRDYLLDEYSLGEDIYLYLTALFSKNGTMYFYVRDFTLKSPEEMYYQRMEKIWKLYGK